MNFEGAVTLIVFIIVVTLVSIILSRYSIETQAVIGSLLVMAAFVAAKVLLHKYREYFVNQWYFTSSTRLSGEKVEGILLPFLSIGGFVYLIVQRIMGKFHKR